MVVREKLLILFPRIKVSDLWMDPLKDNKGKLGNGVTTVEEIIFAGTVIYFDKLNQGVRKMVVMFAVGKDIWQGTIGMLRSNNNTSVGRLGRGIAST